jgi:hypothetical protein
MGYEIVYSYHERLDEGGYNKDETKSMKKRVGDPFEDVCLDKCAGAILAQLARRDIWVTDVEVYELSKKKITFREAKGGSVVLKNKKYQMDGSAGIVSQEITEAPPQQALQPVMAHETPGIVPSAGSGYQPHNRGVLKPIKWVVFQPSYQTEGQREKVKLLQFTIDKRYPVFAEQLQQNGVGMAYKTLDDKNREILVSDEYFIPADAQLVADRELRFSETPAQRDGGNLTYGGYREDNMPKLR